MGGRLITLTAVIGSGKTILSRRLRADLEREGRLIVLRAPSVDKAKISVPLLLAARLQTPPQIGRRLVRAFEAGFEIGAEPIDVGVVEAVLSSQIDDLEPQLTRNGYDLRSLVQNSSTWGSL
jgi:hypothetical protein